MAAVPAHSAKTAPDGTCALFFYGTLVHPAILSRVIGNDGAHLRIQNAFLPDHTLHHILYADYPALLPSSRSSSLFETGAISAGSDAGPLSNSRPPAVRGTLVRGLRPGDVELLDIFEGDEYVRTPLRVVPIPDAPSLPNTERPRDANLADLLADLTPAKMADILASGEGKVEEAHAYIWAAPLERLEGRVWDFAEFARQKANRWVRRGLDTDGEPSADGVDDAEGEYYEVDRRRAMAGQITPNTAEEDAAEAATPDLDSADRPIVHMRSSSSDRHLIQTHVEAPAPLPMSLQDPTISATASAETSAWAASVPAAANPWAENEDMGAAKNVLRAAEEEDRWIGQDTGFERFGHGMRRHFGFKEGYTNLNNGSFGVCPKPVSDAYKSWSDKAEENPDLFFASTLPKSLNKCRQRLAKLINADEDELVLIANATTGTNAVLRDIDWQPGDCILHLSSIYNACGRTVQYICDSHPAQPTAIAIQVSYPISHDAIVELVEQKIKEVQTDGKGRRIRIGIVDALTSNPGVKVPWERLVKLLRQHQILSCVDAAHAIGQIEIDLHKTDPDFFVSNCHKWLYAHRGCAVFYVPKRHQGIQRTSLPTSHDYMSHPTPESNTWIAQWEWTGTLDQSPFLSVDAALDFRERLGGEERIMSYNNDLARKGGAAAAKILGTEVMETERGELTAAMVNIRLPLVAEKDWARPGGVRSYILETLQSEFKTLTPVFEHAGKLWARFSAQIWLEVTDFEYGARALKEICRRINLGEAPLSPPSGAATA